MATKLGWVGSGCAALAVFYACSSPTPSPPRAGGVTGGSTGSSAGGTGGASLGGAGPSGGTTVAGGSGGTGGLSLAGGAGGTGGKATGGTGGVASGGAAGAGMGGGTVVPSPMVRNFLCDGQGECTNTGEQGCRSDTGCVGYVRRGAQAGTALREFWSNVPLPGYPGYQGDVDSFTSCQYSPNFPDNPTSTDQLMNGLTSHAPFIPAQPISYGDNYGERVRGYIKAPVTGNYAFFISSDNSSILFISTDIANGQTESTPLGAKARCVVDDFAGLYTFDQPGQKSQAVAMVAGNYYYFDLFHREANGDGDFFEVRWTRPDRPGTFEKVPADVLYPAEKVPGAPPTRNCPNATGGASGTGGSSSAGAGGV
ncbi:MAG: PA14 domain-containing protein [Polyangiaceae bacterium]|nr:PA14 domain-containing protein [Polyangiaceae bacterium]